MTELDLYEAADPAMWWRPADGGRFVAQRGGVTLAVEPIGLRRWRWVGECWGRVVCGELRADGREAAWRAAEAMWFGAREAGQ